MQGFNRVLLCGHLGGDPELQLSKNGKPYCRLSLATNRSYMNANDEWEKRTEWHSIFVWGPLAERCAHDFRKGALVFVEGSLSYWKVAQDGKERDYKNAVHADKVNLIHQSRENRSPSVEAARGPDVPDFGGTEDLDNPPGSRNHNAVAHPA